MGKKPEERFLRREGAALLAKLRRSPVSVHVTKEGKQRLIQELGVTESNLDELLDLPTTEEVS
jgi:hypothetical protein